MSKHFHPRSKLQMAKRKLFWSYFIPGRREGDSLLVTFLSLLGGEGGQAKGVGGSVALGVRYFKRSERRGRN